MLGDPRRRSAYDTSGRSSAGASGPAFDSSELFADLFRNPILGALFSQLAQEFSRQGLRFDEAYLRRVFAGQQGGAFCGGIVFFGPLGNVLSSVLRTQHRPRPAPARTPEVERRKSGWIRQLLRAALPGAAGHENRDGRLDVSYRLSVSRDVLDQGGRVRVAVLGPSGPETYRVTIPAGTRPGTRLRLAGRGAGFAPDRGDLYLEVLPGG